MALKDIRARHVYAAAAAAFVLLAGFEGARMAAGHDPALAASRPAATPTPAAEAPWWGDDSPAPVPQPESRLS